MTITGRGFAGGAILAGMAVTGRASAQAAPFKIGMLSDMSGIVVDLSGPGSFNDLLTVDAHIRADARTLRDNYVLKVKAPAESSGEWDLYTQIATIPANEAFAAADPKICPLVAG